MKMTIAKFAFVAVLVMVTGCATSEDFVPPPAKPMTVIHNEPQMPVLEVNEKPVAIKPAAAVANETSKSAVKIEVENQSMPSPVARKVALVIQNHALPTRPVPMAALADSLTASLSGRGFHVINPDNVIGAVQNQTAAREAMPPASALNLARSLGAEGLITASVMDFFDTAIDAQGQVHEFSVRLALNLADCATGAIVCGAKVKATSPKKTAAYIKNNGTALYEELLHSAADTCTEQLVQKVSTTGWGTKKANDVSVFFGCNVLGADIQIDGLSYGTCPAQILIPAGPHNLLVSYPPYYLNFARRAMFNHDGQTFAVVLQITPEGEKVRRSGILFDRQKTLFDAELSRYNKSGEVEDYVRKTIADGTSIYWKNSYGRIVVTDASAQNIDFTTPVTDAGDLQDAPNTNQQAKKLKELLMETEKLNEVPATPAIAPVTESSPAKESTPAKGQDAADKEPAAPAKPASPVS